MNNKTTNNENNQKILQMMERMGYKDGLGLGKQQQGILKPIEVKVQHGKKGLGNEVNIDEFGVQYDPEKEIISVEEHVLWLENLSNSKHKYDDLKMWLVLEPFKDSMDDETHFCDPSMLRNVLNAKTILGKFDKTTLQIARAKANPFETVRSAFFMNRAALKMANIDAATDFMFTEIGRNPFHNKNKGPFYFADVCAGPGGFTEYILWRKKWSFKGFGLTLRSKDNDFNLDASKCTSGATFRAIYGATGDGNIYFPENIAHFRDAVFHDTDGEGVHFMMSDGGFSVEGNENAQEVLSKQLYVCQSLMALEIVRPHGHFVSKLFDVFTPFSAGLLYLMHLCFDKITLLKPNASRPANSERYLIGYGLKKNETTHAVRKYLRKIVYNLFEIKQIKKDLHQDIRYIVPLEMMKKNENFMKFMTKINNRIGNNQTIALMKMAEFCINSNLIEDRQEELRIKCLKYWHVPDFRKTDMVPVTLENIRKFIKKDIMGTESIILDSMQDLQKIFNDSEDWSIVPMYAKETHKCTFYAAVHDDTGPSVYRYENSTWSREDISIKLVDGTILYGELVDEILLIKLDSGEVETVELQSFHVIDALRLGNYGLLDLSFKERHDLVDTFCQAVNFESDEKSIRIRSKMIRPLGASGTINFLDYNIAEKKYYTKLTSLTHNSIQEYYFVNSVLFLKTNNNQSFKTSYVLRRQLFNESEENGNNASFRNFVDYVNTCK